MMGGTDLFVNKRHRAVQPKVVVDVNHRRGLGDSACSSGTGLTVGAAAILVREH